MASGLGVGRPNGRIGIKARDLRRALDLVGALGAVGSVGELRSAMVEELNAMIGCDLTVLGTFDPVVLANAYVDFPTGSCSPTAASWCETNFAKHPLVFRQVTAKDTAALTISDFMTQRRFRSSELFSECHNHFGSRYELSLMLPLGGPETATLSLHRTSGDFSVRDRALLDLLALPLAQQWANAVVREQAASLDEGAGRLIHLTALRTIEAITPAAAVTIRALTGEQVEPGDRLPEGIETGEVAIRALARSNGAGQILVLEEPETRIHPTALRASGLTDREIQVLERVDLGETNEQIGLALGISPRTVQKHLERIHEKLGVGTRGAAVARAVELSRG